MAKKKVKIPKERNEMVVALAKRAGAGAGAHEKTKKAKRRAEKVALKSCRYNMKITHYYRYNSHVAEAYGLPLAEIETRHISGDYPFNDDKDLADFEAWMHPQGSMRKMYNADKVWRKIGDNPIEVYKSRDGNYEFDEEEFIQMLFLAEIAGPVSLGA